MKYQTIKITEVVRPMRGRSQAQLVKGVDGKFYVAKFRGNPQGNRTLINEWIATRLLQTLAVSTPSLVLLHLDDEVNKSADLCFRLDGGNIPIETGLHLGSGCPVDLTSTALFDFLPASLLHKVKNIDEFASMLVFDTLMGQADCRQAVFARERSAEKSLFRAYFIDHGKAFNGSAWTFSDDCSHGLYYGSTVYSLFDVETVCERTITALECFNEELLFKILEEVPVAWLAPGDHGVLAKLFTHLLRRRAQVRVLLYRKLEKFNTKVLGLKRDREEAGTLASRPAVKSWPTLVEC